MPEKDNFFKELGKAIISNFGYKVLALAMAVFVFAVTLFFA